MRTKNSRREESLCINMTYMVFEYMLGVIGWIKSAVLNRYYSSDAADKAFTIKLLINVSPPSDCKNPPPQKTPVDDDCRTPGRSMETKRVECATCGSSSPDASTSAETEDDRFARLLCDHKNDRDGRGDTSTDVDPFRLSCCSRPSDDNAMDSATSKLARRSVNVSAGDATDVCRKKELLRIITITMCLIRKYTYQVRYANSCGETCETDVSKINDVIVRKLRSINGAIKELCVEHAANDATKVLPREKSAELKSDAMAPHGGKTNERSVRTHSPRREHEAHKTVDAETDDQCLKAECSCCSLRNDCDDEVFYEPNYVPETESHSVKSVPAKELHDNNDHQTTERHIKVADKKTRNVTPAVKKEEPLHQKIVDEVVKPKKFERKVPEKKCDEKFIASRSTTTTTTNNSAVSYKDNSRKTPKNSITA